MEATENVYAATYGVEAAMMIFSPAWSVEYGGSAGATKEFSKDVMITTTVTEDSIAEFHLEDPDNGDYFVVSICELTESILTAGCFLPTTGCWCLESSCPRSRAAPLAPLHHRRLHEDAASFGTLRWSVPPFTYSF